MTLVFVRGFFLVLCTFVGYYIGVLTNSVLWGIGIGFASGIFLIVLEASLQRVSVRGLSSMVFGLVLGIVMAKMLSDIFALLPLGEFVISVSRVVLTLIFSYLGAVMAMRGKDEFNVIIPYVRLRRQDVKAEVILLDTSVIIDGRVAEVYKSKFLDGRLVVPRFVLQELQKISDSADDIKRQRGRRGMELLRLMQSDPQVDIHVHEDELSGAEGVDSKLVTLAKIMDARICTTDFNLDRIASLQGVTVLNINELVTALKSVLIVGEELEVRLIKEGKESNQAIGYMDDGTMIVVADGRKLIGQKVRATVSSVLQTQAGKMVFAKMPA